MGRNSIKKVRNSNVKKRELYIQKLTETFKQHGLKKYTMDSIAAELNVTKATLYHYFSSKDEMVEISLMKISCFKALLTKPIDFTISRIASAFFIGSF